MATFREILLEVNSDSSDARRDLRELAGEVEAFSRAGGTADLRLNIDQTSLAQARAELAAFKAEAAETIRVRVDVDRGIAGGGARLGAEVLDETADAARAAARGVAQVGQAAGTAARTGMRAMEEGTEQVSAGLRLFGGLSIGLARGPMLVLGAAFAALRAVLGLIGPLIIGVALLFGIALLPAIAALVTSLVGAVAAVGALGTAFVATLGPAALVAIGLFKELAKVFQAVSAMGEAQDARKTTQGQQQIADAQRGVQLATRNLEDAQRSLQDTWVAAHREMEDATERVSDALLGLQAAQLGIERAKLSRADAIDALRDFRKEAGLAGAELDNLFGRITDVHLDPAAVQALLPDLDRAGLSEDKQRELRRLVLDVASANLGIKQANDGLSDQQRELGRAREDASRYAREGVMAYRPLRSAINAVTDATYAQTRATQQLDRALNPARDKIERVHPALQGLIQPLFRLKEAFEQLMGPILRTFAPVFEGIINGIAGGLRRLQPAFLAFAREIAGAIQQLFAGFGSREWMGFFEFLIRSSGRVGSLMTESFGHFLRILRQISRAAMPFLIDALRDLRGWLRRVADSMTSQRGFGQLRKDVKQAYESFRGWVDVVRAFGGLIWEFFRVSSGHADSLAGSMATTLRNWTKWLKNPENAERVRDIVGQSARFMRRLARAVGDVAQWIAERWPEIIDIADDLLGKFGDLVEMGAKLVEIMGDIFGSSINDQTKEGIENLTRAQEQLNKAMDKGESASGRLSNLRGAVRNARLRDDPVAGPIAARIMKRLESLERVMRPGGRNPTAAERSEFNRLIRDIFNLIRSSGFFGSEDAGKWKGQTGGYIPGYGGGDRVRALLERGEYVVRKEVVGKVGVGFMNALNSAAGIPVAMVGGYRAGGLATAGGPSELHQHFHVPPSAPAHPQPDPRATAAQLSMLMRQRGL